MAGCVTRETKISPDNSEESSSGTQTWTPRLCTCYQTWQGGFLDRLPLVSSESDQSLTVQLVILPDKQKPSGHKHVTVDESKVSGLTKTHSTLGILSSWTT
jgi:hypothetical protein